MKQFTWSVYIFQIVSYFFATSVKLGQLLLTKLYFLILKKYFSAKISQKEKMKSKAYVLLFKLFWKKKLSWDNSHFCERFCLPLSYKLYLLLLAEKIQTDKKEYLQSLETPRDWNCLHRWTDTRKFYRR